MPAVHRTYYCSQCKHDWPPLQAYNVCPKCQRCTVAETADDPPNEAAAAALRARYAAFERWLAEGQMATFEAALEATPNIPDPDPEPSWLDDTCPDGA